MIGFIGAGKAGLGLGRYFIYKGLKVAGYYSKSFQSALNCANHTNTTAFSSIDELINLCEIIFITTPDDQILVVAETLLNKGYNGLVCHTSGVLPANDMLYMFSNSASIHPPYPFASNINVQELDNIIFTIEGSGSDDLATLLNEYNITFLKIQPEQKPLYHLSACILSNFMVTLCEFGYNIMDKTGLPHEMFNALIQNNITNIIDKGTKDALTGPIARGDINTIKKHLSLLEGDNKKLYISLALETIKITNLDSTTKIELTNILKSK